MNDNQQNSFSRRQFLEAAGFTMSLAAISGCGRAPTEVALPFAIQPEGVVPGRMQSYASTCAGCSAGCGLLVGVRDGRPLKMEGMPEHPLSAGGLCAVGQALPLGLYDSHRLTHPLADAKESDWATVDKEIKAKLKVSEGAVVVVTNTVTSPTLQAEIDNFVNQFSNGRHVTFDAASSSAILDAHQQTHGTRVLPRYRFDRAKVIVSFGADFLGTWISPVEFTAAWRHGRIPSETQPEMSCHVQLEERVSLTGSNADRRYRLSEDEYGAVLSRLALDIGSRATLAQPTGQMPYANPLPPDDQADLAKRLWSTQGECLIVSDSQDIQIQRLVNYLNHALGNYGKTLDVENPSRQRQGNDAEVAKLIDDIHSGSVSALIVAGTDLTHHLPNRDSLAAAIEKVPLVVSCAERVDDFASLAHFVCPVHHSLESWADAEPVAGIVSLSQPTLEPLGNTRPLLESLSLWSGGRGTAYDIIQTHWQSEILPRAKQPAPFQQFWDQAVHDGFVQVRAEPVPMNDFDVTAVTMPATKSGDGLSLSLYHKVGMPDSRHAHNPWLQELPDPVTKMTWDNYASISEAVAVEHNVGEGDVVRVTAGNGASVELPALIQRGQHDHVVAIALGYGVKGTDRFANIGPDWIEAKPTIEADEFVGKNASGLLEFHDSLLQPTRSGIILEKLSSRRELAATQLYHSLEMPEDVAPQGAEVRDIVQKTTLPAFQKNPAAGKPVVHHHGDEQLWAEDHPKTHHHWGMVIDLNCCTGCSACLIACQSENNVPVVGKDEVRRGREMHWIRIDRYYGGEDDDLSVAHQPMMCQHCDNAPCETVCPVLATVHGDEGLNEQAYNRCVGTRYCANNCPYKVRRFNWFKYEHDDLVQNLALNPDVTVRTRGVMEKCSMCVQRIEQGKIEAKRNGLPLADGDIQTACQQSCPAQAIMFGDMNDSESQIGKALQNPRRYGALEEFNFRPSVSYLRVVKNREEDVADHHSGEQSPATHETREDAHHA